jgi:hypothetical protein
MWLDRLSSNSTPSVSPPPSSNRAPIAHRPSHLAPYSSSQRPGFNPRSSSLSLASNDSTTSLLAASKRTNGSGFKQSNTLSDTTDPLQVLEKLLGREARRFKDPPTTAANGSETETEDNALELDFGGLSLQEFVTREDPSSRTQAAYNTQTVHECMYIPAHSHSITDCSSR